MIGILTEKPSAAKNFRKALGADTYGKGTYNGEQYIIAASVGHLYEFVNPEEQVEAHLQEKYKDWNLDNLPWNENDFSWKKQLKSNVTDVIKNIKQAFSDCDEIIIATDVDPSGEGELLAWEILHEGKITAKKYSRMYFEDESVKQLQKAFTNRKPIQSMLTDMDYIKADYRSKFDYLTMQFTRIATMCGNGYSVLRQGRLKSAMVQIVGDGLKAVNEYKKIPYYQNRFKDENGNAFSFDDEPSFPDKSQVSNTYSPATVVIDSKETKSTAPPKLLDLAALSAKLSSKGIKAKEVLTVYQKMYEDQVVSYPRTEDKTITPEQFNELLPLINKIASVVGVDTSLLTHREPRKTHVKSGGAHGANRPGINVPESLDSLKKYGACAPMIYDILAKNYLATLAEDYEYEHQKGHLQEYPNFKGTANIPKKLGFKLVFSAEENGTEEYTNDKELGHKAIPFIYEGFPTKPPIPTFKWLVKQLEKHDVGTGATRTSIYADVTNETAKYPLLIENKGKLSMSKYGEMSYQLLKDTHIGDIKITEKLMTDMRDIADGKAHPDNCLRIIRQWVIDDIETMKRNGANISKEMPAAPLKEVIGICPKCGKPVYEGQKNYYCSGYKDGCNFTLWKSNKFFDSLEKSITNRVASSLLKNKKVKMTGLKAKSGKTFDATITVEWKEPYPKFNLEFDKRTNCKTF